MNGNRRMSGRLVSDATLKAGAAARIVIGVQDARLPHHLYLH